MHEGADAKAENDALHDDVAAGRDQPACSSSLSVSATTTASGVDNAASPDWQTPLNGIISPSEADHYAKQLGRNPSILMSSADRVAHIDGQLIWVMTYTRFQRYKCLK